MPPRTHQPEGRFCGSEGHDATGRPATTSIAPVGTTGPSVTEGTVRGTRRVGADPLESAALQTAPKAALEGDSHAGRSGPVD